MNVSSRIETDYIFCLKNFFPKPRKALDPLASACLRDAFYLIHVGRIPNLSNPPPSTEPARLSFFYSAKGYPKNGCNESFLTPASAPAGPTESGRSSPQTFMWATPLDGLSGATLALASASWTWPTRRLRCPTLWCVTSWVRPLHLFILTFFQLVVLRRPSNPHKAFFSPGQIPPLAIFTHFHNVCLTQIRPLFLIFC